MKQVLTILALSVLMMSCGAEVSPDTENCGVCHSSVFENTSTSLHYTGDGMMSEYECGAAGYFGIDMPKMYEEKNCAKCHVTSCVQCHGESPHTEDLSGNIETCDVCHLKKQASFIGDMPMHKSKGPSADIHYELGFTCTDCHSAEGVHGDGTLYTNMLDAVKVKCEDCHEPSTSESHTVHNGKLDCSACHSAWMTTCVNCHLDTMKTESVTTDKFYLARASDDKVKPFMQMESTLDDSTHVAYAEYYPHTITDEGRVCEDCHENEQIFASNGQLIGPKGATFVTNVKALPEPESVPTPTSTIPGFGAMVFIIAGLLAYRIRS